MICTQSLNPVVNIFTMKIERETKNSNSKNGLEELNIIQKNEIEKSNIIYKVMRQILLKKRLYEKQN